VTCGRVVSIALSHTDKDFLEVGAEKSAVNFLGCGNQDEPADNNWYRFWWKEYKGACSIPRSFTRYAGATYHQAAIYRDGSDVHKFHIEWDFATYATFGSLNMTSGVGIVNWERYNGNDSGYSEWDGVEYMDVNGNFHLWSSVCYYADNDGTYGLHVVTTSHLKVDATPNGYKC
jgi:hypothetical protein